jgi:hypothetical protein
VKNAAILLSSVAIAVILIAGLASQAHANQLDALLLPAEDRSQAQFTAFRNIELRYPQSSSLASLLDGRNERIEFTVNGTGAQALVDAMNRAIQEQKSPVALHNATVNYVATIKGQPDRAQLSYKVDVKATIAGYVLQKETGNRSAIVDLDWRNFVVSVPVMMIDTERGPIDINSPAGALQVMMPQLAAKLGAKEAQAIMGDPILDFSRFNLPMKSWHYLFDVTGLQLKNYGVFMPGEGATVSIHSIGESSFREGTYLPKEMDATVQVEGAQVTMHASTPAPSGQITIAGYSKVQEANGTEYAEVSSKHSGGLEMGFQFQVMLVLAGMMGAVAMFVLYKSRR